MLYTLKFQRNPARAKAPEVAFRGQFVELMGGVEQISNFENVEISRKERRPSRSVSKSVSKVQSLIRGIYSILNKLPYFTNILCKSVVHDTKIYMTVIMDYPVP